jgi:hypothetical protein
MPWHDRHQALSKQCRGMALYIGTKHCQNNAVAWRYTSAPSIVITMPWHGAIHRHQALAHIERILPTLQKTEAPGKITNKYTFVLC